MVLTDTRILEVLRKHELRTDAWAQETLRDTITTMAEIAATSLDGPTLTRRDAEVVRNSAARLLEKARAFQLSSESDLVVVEMIKVKAELVHLVNNRRGVEPRRWLGICCEDLLLNNWRAFTDRSDSVYDWGDRQSPALLFLTDCCGLIDPSLTPASIYKAVKAFRREKKTDAATSDAERMANYEAWWNTDIGKKTAELRALEATLRAAQKAREATAPVQAD